PPACDRCGAHQPFREFTSARAQDLLAHPREEPVPGDGLGVAVVLGEWVRGHGWSFLAGRDTPYGTSFRQGYPRSTAGYRTARIAAGSGRPPSSDQVPSSTVNAGVFVDESPLFAGLISHRDSSPVLPGPAVQRRSRAFRAGSSSQV